MKSRLFAVALLVAVVSFSACREDKSKECDMLTVTINSVPYELLKSTSGGSFTYIYPKASCPGVTIFAPSGSVKADIAISPKATCFPNKDGSYNFASEQEFIVTAEDGKTKKTYTIQFSKDTTSPCSN